MMLSMILPLRDVDIARSFVCPHWPYWDRFGDPALKRDNDEARTSDLFEKLWMEQELIQTHAPEAVWIDQDLTDEEAAIQTQALMTRGVPAIAHPVLRTDGRQGKPSLLIRTGGTSRLGDWKYAPLDIRRAIHLRKDEAFRLYFYEELLRELQGATPAFLRCLNRDGELFDAPNDQWREEYPAFIRQLERVTQGECPLPVYRKGCADTSPWGQACLALAVERDDIALLFSISQKQMDGLRAQGIETIHQAADMDPLQLEGVAPGLTLRALLRLQRQARSLVDRSVLIREPWPAISAKTIVAFDIETHPGTDQDYLYGFVVEHAGNTHEYTLTTLETPHDEAWLWNQFLALIPTLPPEYAVYHYGDYEVTRLQTLAKRYKTEQNPWLIQFMDRFVDIKELVRDSCIFPLFFYSLKAVAGFLGFAREQDVRHGRDSVLLYEQWLRTQDPTLAQALIQYNRDDVYALIHVLRWAITYATREGLYTEPYPWSV